MSKTALITGATDGIGRATALELASRGYTIHALGRNEERGQQVLEEIKRLEPAGEHVLHLVDLSRIDEVISFADEYQARSRGLDVLLLNAGVFPDKGAVSGDGLDLVFAVNYLSRFVLVDRLDELLAESDVPRVVYLGGSRFVDIPYDQLRSPGYGKMRAIWQASTASALFAEWWARHAGSQARHTYWTPGIVETGLVTSQNAVVRAISKLMGSISPALAATRLADHVDADPRDDPDDRYYKDAQARPWKSRVVESEESFVQLLEFSQEASGICK